MKKKAVLLLAFSVLTLSLLSACGSSSSASAKTENVAEEIKAPTVTPAPIDYADAESFEYALNHGAQLEGKIVQFVVREYHPDSAIGYNAWAGEHLNFINKEDLKLSDGETVVGKAVSISQKLGSWSIMYEVVENAAVNEHTISAENLTTIDEDAIYSFKNNVYIGKNVRIEITDVEVLMPGSEFNRHPDVPLIRFTYKVTNVTGNSNVSASSSWIQVFNAFQDNDPNFVNELEVGPQEDTKYHQTGFAEIKAGGTVEDVMTYKLDDLTTPVILKAYISGNNVLGEQEFDLSSIRVSQSSNNVTATNTPAPTPQSTEKPEGQSEGISAEFKAAMDSYEAFFDEYVAFMEKYNKNPTDMSLLLEYTSFMTQYQDTMTKINGIDTTALSPEELSYYLEVMGRINQKLLSVANTLNG